MATDSDLYVLRGTDGEFLLVFRTYDEDELWSALRRLGKIRRLKSLASKIEVDLNCQQQEQ